MKQLIVLIQFVVHVKLAITVLRMPALNVVKHSINVKNVLTNFLILNAKNVKRDIFYIMDNVNCVMNMNKIV